MRKHIRKTLLCLCIFLLMALVGCSYREFEDSIRDKAAKGDGDYANEAEIPEETGENIPGSEKEPEESEQQNAVGAVGDTIRLAYDPESGEVLAYTLEKVETGISMEELGLVPEDFDDASIFDEKGVLKESADCQLVVVTVTVKNVNVDLERLRQQTGEQDPLFIEMFAGSESNILHPDGPFLLEACCFTEHPENIQDFYKFSLEKEEEMTARVGWLVPNEMLEEPFYYVIGAGLESKSYQYFLLN